MKMEALKKAQAALEKTKATLEKAEAELKAKPKDENLKKKVAGLTSALLKAEEKVKVCEKALKDAKPEKPGEDSTGELVRLKASSTTGNPSYYRCGLRFGKSAEDYEVTAEVAAVLEKDKWLKVERVK